MGKLKKMAKRFHAGERAAEVAEFGIVLALLVAIAVAAIAVIGPKIAAAYNLTNNGM